MHARDGGSLGRWILDESGMPAFVLESGLDTAWHQVGNRAVTATAHAGGWTTLYATQWGWIRLSDPDPALGTARGGTWHLTDSHGARVQSEAVDRKSVV